MKGVGRRILALGLAPIVILGSSLSGEYLKSTRSSSDYSVLKARPSKKYWTDTQKCDILCQSYGR